MLTRGTDVNNVMLTNQWFALKLQWFCSPCIAFVFHRSGLVLDIYAGSTFSGPKKFWSKCVWRVPVFACMPRFGQN